MRLVHSTLTSFVCLIISGLSSASALEISGSDLLGPVIQDALQMELEAAGVDVTFSFEGSLLGVESLESGTSDAVLLATPDGSQASDATTGYPLGFQVVAFAVNEANPLKELSYNQLSGLFGESGLLSNWADLTPIEAWDDRTVSMWAARSSSSISLEIFNALVLKGKPLKQSVRYSGGNPEELLSIVVENPSAIVLAPVIKAQPMVRLLAIKQNDDGQSYTPSLDNIYFGDYPLRLPFQMTVSKTLDQKVLGPLVKALYSTAVTEAMESAGYISLPVNERQAILSQTE